MLRAKHICKKNPDKAFAYLCGRFRNEFDADPLAFDRVENIRNGRYPLLLTAGSNEQMDDVLLQFQNNNPMKTTILILPGCNHGNGMYKQTEMYQSAIKAFIEEHMHV